MGKPLSLALQAGEPLLAALGVEPDEECNAAKGDAAESDNHRNHIIYFLVIEYAILARTAVETMPITKMTVANL